MKKFFTGIFHFLYSLRVQILLVVIAAGLIPMFILMNIITDSYNNRLISQRADELKSYGTVISNLVLSTDYLKNHSSDDVDTEVNEIAEVYNGRILIIDNNLKVIKDTYNIEKGKTIISTEVIKCFYNARRSQYVNELGDYIQLTMPIVESGTSTVQGTLIMSFSEKNLNLVSKSVIQNLQLIILLIIIIIIILSAAYSFFITSPLKKVTKSINEVGQGNMDINLNVHGYAEIRDLSNSFNAMIDMIRRQDTSRQEFVSNVSHELKTPLASVKVLCDSLLSASDDVSVDFYKEFMGDISSEIDRMNDIVTDLLSMTRLENKNVKLDIVNTSINDMIEALIKRLRPIAEKRKIELIYESFRPVNADVDVVKFQIALNNLIENAIKYNYDSGWVKIALNADHKFFYVTVQDCGVGIPEELQDKIFERFYRVDKARSRDTGGTGLGLSITRKIILLHKGSIRLYSKEKEGTTFTVRVPLNYVRNDTNEN